MLTPCRDDRGATAIIVAAGMLLFLGMAALAVDYGLGVNERRIDQTAADTGATAGAVEAMNGGPALRDQALNYVRLNLPTTYSNGDWQTLWESCVDPAAERNDGGYNFVALPPPAGWTVTDPANWCLSFESSRGLFRVRVPSQIIDAAFGPVLGIDHLSTKAAAVSRIGIKGLGGVLPFGIPSGSGGGGHLCLSSSPTGIAIDPCTGSASGNFGTLKARKFGNDDIPTAPNCNASPLNDVLAQNIAHGVDHLVIPDADWPIVGAANEVRDECFNPLVDTMNTDTGFPNNGAEEGLVGPVPGSYTPRLALGGGGPNVPVFGFTVDNTPLWSYLTGGASYGADPAAFGGPLSCRPWTFGSGMTDWDGDGVDDGIGASWQHMQDCLDQYAAGVAGVQYTGVIFNSSLAANPARFGYVPEFWESTLGTGNSWLHVKRFRAVYLQSTTWKQGGDYLFHHPGEFAGSDYCQQDDGSGGMVQVPCSGSASMVQLTAFVIPDAALPESIRGDPPPGGTGVNPFTVELYR